VLAAQRISTTRRLGDLLVLALLAANAAPTGLALGAYGPGLLRYLPQLPLEWLGLALAAGSWLRVRRALEAEKRLLPSLLAVTGALLGAALLLETFATPNG
jgi:hypothetical protein